MKPEHANLFTVVTTGQNNDLVISFFYEWRETEDGETFNIIREKVSSIIMNINDAAELSAVLDELLTTLKGGDTVG